MTEQTTEEISPGTWCSVRVDRIGQVVQALNLGSEYIRLTFTDDPDDTGVSDGDTHPEHGWRVRRRPYDPERDRGLPGADAAHERWEAEQVERNIVASREADAVIGQHLADGRITLTGQTPDGTRTYRITAAGARWAEQTLQLPTGTIRYEDDILDR